MRSLLKYTVLSLLCWLFLMSTMGYAQKSSGKGVEVEFPDIEGWERGDIQTYPTAELGYSVPYQSDEGGSVTVYVYNGGLKKISDGVEDANVKAQIEQAKNDIVQAGELGYYDNVKHVKDGTITLGGTDGKVKALYSLFTFKLRGQEAESEIYLFGYQDNFIKLRATRPKSKEGAENKATKTLLAAIGKMFSQ
jgi:hypothetical protein